MKFLHRFTPWKVDDLCKKYNISNYEFKNGLVNVDGNVDLSYRMIYEMPLNFGIISGNFNCGRNFLINLNGSPKSVGGNFGCDRMLKSAGHTKKFSLKGGPNNVGGIFDCQFCKLENLHELSENIEQVLFSFNKIYDFKDIPQKYLKNIKRQNIEGNPFSTVWYEYNNVGDVDWKRSFDMEFFQFFLEEVEDFNPIKGNIIFWDRLCELFEDSPKGSIKDTDRGKITAKKITKEGYNIIY